MDDSKTVSSDMLSDLYINQTKDVANMRSSLLSFNKKDPNSAKQALQNITVLRVYHQLSRIIRYTETMDKIEDKMYESINATLDDMDEYDPKTWSILLNLQSKLQQSMIESHKLLEPYLNMEALSVVEMQPNEEDPSKTFTAMILDQTSREKVRTSAQEVLAAITAAEDKEANE